MANGKEVYIVCGPGLGSTQHYFHFLFALLIPLINSWGEISADTQLSRVFVKSCGPLDKILHELDLPQVEIASELQYRREILRARSGKPGGAQLVTLKRYDFPRAYRSQVFRRARDLLFFRYAERIKMHRAHIDAQFSPASPRIIFINRGEPDKFYASQQSEVKSAGAERRSIPNFMEAAEALSQKFGNVVSMTLEGKSFLYQVALFSAVDLIICQHGAALANLVWARPGTRAIEIMPDDIASKLNFNFFGRLAPYISVESVQLPQASSHAPLDVAKLSGAVGAALSGQSADRDRWPGAHQIARFSPKSPCNSWLGEGWLEPAVQGAWSVGPIATIRLPPLNVTTPWVKLFATVRGAVAPWRARQEVRVIVNGVYVGSWSFRHGETGIKRVVNIPTSLLQRDAPVQLRFDIADFRSAAEVEGSKDDRELGIVLKDLRLVPAEMVGAVPAKPAPALTVTNLKA